MYVLLAYVCCTHMRYVCTLTNMTPFLKPSRSQGMTLSECCSKSRASQPDCWYLLGACMYVCMHACMHVGMYICMYVCMYESSYMDVLPHIIMFYALSDQAPISLNVCTFCECAYEHVAYLHG